MAKLGLLLAVVITTILGINCSITNLPDDILYELFQFQNCQELRSTCKYLKKKFDDYLRGRRYGGEEFEGVVGQFGIIRVWQVTSLCGYDCGRYSSSVIYSDTTRDTSSGTTSGTTRDTNRVTPFGIRNIQDCAYNPTKSKNHIKLLKFLAKHDEFQDIHTKLKSNVQGFLLPMIKHYENQIHGLDQFIKIYKCAHLVRNEERDRDDEDCKCHLMWRDELEMFYMIFYGLTLMQG